MFVLSFISTDLLGDTITLALLIGSRIQTSGTSRYTTGCQYGADQWQLDLSFFVLVLGVFASSLDGSRDDGLTQGRANSLTGGATVGSIRCHRGRSSSRWMGSWDMKKT